MEVDSAYLIAYIGLFQPLEHLLGVCLEVFRYLVPGVYEDTGLRRILCEYDILALPGDCRPPNAPRTGGGVYCLVFVHAVYGELAVFLVTDEV